MCFPQVKNLISLLLYQAGGSQHGGNKIPEVREWPEPKMCKELQTSLSFDNFCQHFIRNFSAVAAPLSDLHKGNRLRRAIHFTLEARCAFADLKRRFASAPTLCLPGPRTAIHSQS